jgi:hypothetical protein
LGGTGKKSSVKAESVISFVEGRDGAGGAALVVRVRLEKISDRAKIRWDTR